MPIAGYPIHPTGLDLVANLERLADSQAHGLHTPSHTQNTGTQRIESDGTPPVPSTTTEKPPRKRNKTKGKNKRNKRKRGDNGSGSENEDDQPTFDPAQLKDSDKTALQLRYLAEKHATAGMSDELIESLLDFHEEIQTMIAIKALELGTTVSAIEGVFRYMFSGKYIGVCRPSRWNRFLQSVQARAIFKLARGVGSGQGMRELSRVWRSMTEAEKDVYKEATQETDTANLQAMDQDLAELEIGPRSRDQILQSRSNTLINPRSLKLYKDNAEKYLDEIMAKCIPITRSNHFEIVVVAVSNHISTHSFQFTRSTLGVKKVVEEIYAIDGVNNFATEVQAHLVGQRPSELGVMGKSENGRAYQSRVTASLSTFLRITADIQLYLEDITGLRHWPWSKCDLTLREAGYKLELLPGAQSVEATFKQNSRHLNRAKLLAIESDLKDHLIQLVKTNEVTPAQNTNANTTNQPSPIDRTNTNTTDGEITSNLDPIFLE
ncbi:uncharacterized protein MELLADRAFT_84610 [Melampsora larici-populina 98AG31]|uniref:Uncharacterized protein n=1 Tax=Melampsora larici-populina (strain 98AG31 / pathotype 3-4-7) TaxID=747676 RepID=F4RGA5_MELLP|nr:uncharacterized protein MELLADRAFT_84610 [Melampsora larici-populina 98AG31]EGG08439.1 hypothetical protein MELLADRAFT_84610 [Melampsora larici-populina 98AG31]